jgi:hypothetical protein
MPCGILEMCVSVARWFDPDGRLSAEQVASEHARFALRLVAAAEPADKDPPLALPPDAHTVKANLR